MASEVASDDDNRTIATRKMKMKNNNNKPSSYSCGDFWISTPQKQQEKHKKKKKKKDPLMVVVSPYFQKKTQGIDTQDCDEKLKKRKPIPSIESNIERSVRVTNGDAFSEYINDAGGGMKRKRKRKKEKEERERDDKHSHKQKVSNEEERDEKVIDGLQSNEKVKKTKPSSSIEANTQLSLSDGIVPNGSEVLIAPFNEGSGKKMKKKKKKKEERKEDQGRDGKHFEKVQQSQVIRSLYFQKVVKEKERDEKNMEPIVAINSNIESDEAKRNVANGAVLSVSVEIDEGSGKKKKKKRSDDCDRETTPSSEVISPYSQKHVSDEEERNANDNKMRTEYGSCTETKISISPPILPTNGERNEAIGAAHLSDNYEGDGKKRRRKKDLNSVLIAPCSRKRVKEDINEDEEEEKMQLSFSVEGKTSTSIPANDGDGGNNKAETDDLFSQFVYKGGSNLKRGRADVDNKNVWKPQVCRPYFEKIAMEKKGEEEEDKEKKAAGPDFIVKKKIHPFILGDEGFGNGVHVTESEAVFSPHVGESLMEEKGPINETKIEKVSSKWSRKDEKCHKKARAEVRVVSPYFMNSTGEQVVISEGKHLKIKSTKPRAKKNPTALKVSPYFHNIPKEKEDAVADSLEGRTECKALPNKDRTASVIKPVLSAAQKLDEAYRRRTPDNTWKPPRSHFNLLQEDHAHDPWRVLVICMLLNRTSGLQAGRVIAELFTLCPNAKIATEAAAEEIEKVIQTLGFQRKRAMMIQRFSQEYLGERWTHVTQLHGVGKYAADAYAIFCTGKWDRVTPSDHMLNKYWDFLHGNGVTLQ